MITFGKAITPGVAGSRLPFAPPVTLGVGAAVVDITDVRVGTAQAKAVMYRGTQVWPKPSPWIKCVFDQPISFPTIIGDWFGGAAPDLSDRPAPVKGSVIFLIYTIAGNLSVAPVVYDGTKWVESDDACANTYNKDVHGHTYYTMYWYNSPTGRTDVDDHMNGPDGVGSSPTIYAYAAPDGIHITMTDHDGGDLSDYVDPYPPGVTQADMPPSGKLVV